MAKLGTKVKTSTTTPEVEKKVEVTYPNKAGKSVEGILGYGSVNLVGHPVFINSCLLYDGSPEGAEKEYDPFVKYPQSSYQDENGETKWKNVAGVSTQEARQIVLETVIHCFEKMADGEDVGEEYKENGVTLKYPTLNPISGKENVLMRFSLNVEDLPVYINSLTVRTRPDGTFWTAFPERPYEKDGEKKWAPIAGPANTETNKTITEALVEAINAK